MLNDIRNYKDHSGTEKSSFARHVLCLTMRGASSRNSPECDQRSTVPACQ